MTDLSNLFRQTTRFSTPVSSPSTHPPPLSSQRQSSEPVQRATAWNMGDLQSLVSKSVRREVEGETVQKQLHILNESQLHILPRKLGAMLLVALLPVIAFNREVHLAILVILMLLAYFGPSQQVSLKNWNVIAGALRWVKPMVYNCVFYLILKQVSGDFSSSLNWPLVFHSILANFTHEVCEFYRPIFQLSAAEDLVAASAEPMTLRKVPHLGKYMSKRVLFIVSSFKSILLVHFCFGIVVSLIMVWQGLFDASFVALSFYLRSLAVLIGLELFLQLESFINTAYSEPLRVVSDKMPVFLTLLKLSNRPEHSLIHEICLRSLYSHVLASKFYLSIETCKSLTYKTYMDIFNQFGEIEIIRILSEVGGSLIAIKSQQRVLNSDKSALDDIFIYGKKLYAYLRIEYEVLNMIKVLAKSSFLMAIIVQSEKQATSGNESVRISPRIIENTRSVQEKLIEAAKTATATKLSREQLITHSMRMSSWVFWLKGSD